ncbi:MAG: hypothetical protein Q9222_004931, partial [Ikaeria aurantiellina]
MSSDLKPKRSRDEAHESDTNISASPNLHSKFPKADEANPRGKTIIVLCDGTGNDSVQGPPPPTNVARLASLLSLGDSWGNPQIQLYLPGVGTRYDLDKLVGGIFGTVQNIATAYNFIASNYEPGDRIILIGFSRGAYTARSVAGLIGEIGCLKRKARLNTVDIFQKFRERFNHEGKITAQLTAQWVQTRNALVDQDQTYKDVKIKAVAVFDTVGSLGVPTSRHTDHAVANFDTHVNESHEALSVVMDKDQLWHDVGVGKHMENAFHALALDETRIAFAPTLWENAKPEEIHTQLKQCWFIGSHSNVGGGYDDNALADESLLWMIAQLQELIKFDQEALGNHLQSMVNNALQWQATGPPHGCVTMGYGMTGSQSQPRTPGCYYRLDPTTGIQTGQSMANTNETIHFSVQSRWKMDPTYRDSCRALQGFTGPVPQNDNHDTVLWPRKEGSHGAVLAQEPMTQLEKDYLVKIG